MLEPVLQWTSSYGYPVLFAALMLGVFGVPVPDEVLLAFAGFLAWNGDLNPVLAILVATAGSACGITLSYLLGRGLGGRFVARLRRIVHLDDARLSRSRAWFEHAGRWWLLVGYFVPGVRHATALAAGASSMPYAPFALFAYAGALLWTTAFVSAGFLLGPEWRPLVETVAAHVRVIGPVAILALLALLLVRRRVRDRRLRREPPSDPHPR